MEKKRRICTVTRPAAKGLRNARQKWNGQHAEPTPYDNVHRPGGTLAHTTLPGMMFIPETSTVASFPFLSKEVAKFFAARNQARINAFIM